MPTPPQKQAEWVRLYRQTRANHHFENLYHSTRRAIFARCLKILRDEGLAEDATHETFLRAFQKFDELQGDNFLAWTASIATHLCLNRLRNRRTRTRLKPEISESRASTRTPDRDFEQQRRRERAEQALATLGRDQRKILLLKYLEGYSYAEITELTGYGHDRIRSLLQNGKRNFRLRWREQNQDETA